MIRHAPELALLLAVALLSSMGGAEEPAEPGPAAPAERPARSAIPLGLNVVDSDLPIRIQAQSLEAVDRDGRRHLRFEGGVEVQQGDVKLRADHLDAHYPPESSQPDRLVAGGTVRLAQGERQARCNEAVYERVAQRIICSGDAELRQGEDSVRGDVIEFDIASGRVVIRGGASLEIHPRAEEAEESDG